MTDPYNPNPSHPNPQANPGPSGDQSGTDGKTEIVNLPGGGQSGAPQADPTTMAPNPAAQNPGHGQPQPDPYQQNPYQQPYGASGQPPYSGPAQSQPTQVGNPGQYGQPGAQQQYGQPAAQYGAPGQYGSGAGQYGAPGQGQYGQQPYGQNPQGVAGPNAQNPYGQNQYGQNQYGQNQYGGGDQFSGMATGKSNKTARTLMFVGGGALILIAAIVLITAFLFPGWAPKNLDQQAAQDGVQKILTEDYQASEVSDVQCPSGQRVETGASFTCSVTVGGQQQQVTVTFIDDDGRYEVSRPS